MQRNWSSITIHNRCINFKSFCDSNEPIMSSDIYHCQKLQFHQKIILQSYYSAEDNEFTFLPLLHLKLCIGMQIKYTYLIGHNNQINGFRTAATHPSWRLYFLRAYASWLHLSMTGLPRFGFSNGYKVIRLLQIPASNTCLAGASSSIRTAWPSQRSRWILRCITSMSLRSSYSSLLNRMRKSSPTRTGPKILRRTFLSNTLKAAASVFNSVHASAA